MKINNNIVAQLPFALLFLVTLGMFTNDTQGVLNVSAVLLLLYTLYSIFKSKVNITGDIIALVKARKVLFLFGFWGLFCAIFFTYSSFKLAAVKAFFNDWRYIIIITLFLIVFKNNTTKSQKTISYALITTLAFIIFAIPILKLLKDNSDLPLYLQLRFGFAHYMTLLFPFTFATIFLSQKKVVKIATFILSILASLFLLYTGSRGGVLAIIIEIVVILLIFSSNYKEYIISLTISATLTSAIIGLSYLYIPQVQHKINQTIYSQDITSKRDKIIETRFPIFMNQISTQLTGIGYGSVAYNQFLLDHKAPKNQGGMGYSAKRKSYHYNNDEPFFLNITYNIGFIGLLLFLSAFFINMKDLFKDIKGRKNILNVGIFVSSIGYFLIYCLFEFIFIDIFILYNILTAIFIRKVLSK